MFKLRRSKYPNYSTNGHILIQNSVFCIHQKTYLKQIYWSSKPGLGERLERPQCTKSCLHVCTLEGALADWRRSRESILQSQKTKDDWLQFALLLSPNVPGQSTFEYEHKRWSSRSTKLLYFDHPAHALRALGLLLADGALTVGWGKTFWCIGRVPSLKRA